MDQSLVALVCVVGTGAVALLTTHLNALSAQKQLDARLAAEDKRDTARLGEERRRVVHERLFEHQRQSAQRFVDALDAAILACSHEQAARERHEDGEADPADVEEAADAAWAALSVAISAEASGALYFPQEVSEHAKDAISAQIDLRNAYSAYFDGVEGDEQAGENERGRDQRASGVCRRGTRTTSRDRAAKATRTTRALVSRSR